MGFTFGSHWFPCSYLGGTPEQTFFCILFFFLFVKWGPPKKWRPKSKEFLISDGGYHGPQQTSAPPLGKSQVRACSWDKTCGSFFTQTCFIGLFTVSEVNQKISLILSSGNFPGEGGVVPFWDAIHDKYLIKILKQHAILLRIEWRTRWWRFRFDTVSSFLDIDL